MKFDAIIKIIIYLIIFRAIVGKINKRKNTRSNKKEDSTSRRYNRQEKTGMEEEQRDKKYNKKMEINNFKDIMSKSNRPSSPEERMKQREKELENMNKR